MNDPCDASSPALRIGVLLETRSAPRWVRRVLLGLRGADFLELALVILTGPTRPRRHLRAALWDLYVNLDRRVFRTPADPFELEDVSRELSPSALLEVVPASSDAAYELAPADVEAIRAKKLDVLIDLGSRRLSGAVLRAARHGVWAHRYEGACPQPGGEQLFERLLAGCPRTRTSLHILGADGEPDRVIYRSVAATDTTSLQRTLEPACWKTADFALRCLRDLHTRGFESLAPLDSADTADDESHRASGSPGSGAMLTHLARLACRLTQRRIEHVRTRPRWSIAVRRRSHDELEAPRPEAYVQIPQPRARVYADPFPLEVDGRGYVFFEDFPYKTRKGVISYVALKPDGSPGEVRSALERDYHLSYPFVFRWDGAVWMIPESEQNRSVELYRAVDFPDSWRLEKLLFEGVRAVDATLLEHAGRFWLFMNMSPSGGSLWDELFLFHADSPLGEWIPHERNPVVSDVTRARPGGTILRIADRLIRPAQDSSVRYGWALTLNRIDVLSERDYQETPISRIDADWYPGAIGTHTLSRSETLEAIDWKLRVPRS